MGSTLEIIDAGLELVEHARAMGTAANRVSLAAMGQADGIDGTVGITASELLGDCLDDWSRPTHTFHLVT
ncbi:MAG: hypothetical protein AAGF12_16455 [Myxococcota bacterium]